MNLVIINNLSKDSTVLRAFLPIVRNHYDSINIVFPSRFDASAFFSGEKTRFNYPNASDYFSSFFLLLAELFSKETLIDLKNARKIGKLKIRYLVTYIKILYVSVLQYKVCNSILRNNSSDYQVFSMWFSNNAIAAAKIKRKYPNIVVASYAHSYEVDLIKNPYVGLLRDRFKCQFLDCVYFISSVVMQQYNKYINDLGLKCGVFKGLHFGSAKLFSKTSSISTDCCFRILTCSGLSPVKRLDILAEALRLVDVYKVIEWTIIGSGPELNKIKDIVSQLDTKRIKVRFLGSLTNKEVHAYYANNPVDLFINISSSEGLPVSIMEAMSYGVPVLATDVGGNREIVSDKNGMLIDSDISSIDVANAISKLISVDLTEKRINAFDEWKNNYQIDKNVTELINDLNNLKG